MADKIFSRIVASRINYEANSAPIEVIIDNATDILVENLTSGGGSATGYVEMENEKTNVIAIQGGTSRAFSTPFPYRYQGKMYIHFGASAGTMLIVMNVAQNVN